jgi:hypothetical protein
MCLEPVAKGNHKLWTFGRILRLIAWADSTIDKIPTKKLHSKARMVANLPALEMRTSATPKMATEGIKSVLVYIRENTSLSLNEAAKMRCGSNISNCTGLGVLIALQDTGKPVDI